MTVFSSKQPEKILILAILWLSIPATVEYINIFYSEAHVLSWTWKKKVTVYSMQQYKSLKDNNFTQQIKHQVQKICILLQAYFMRIWTFKRRRFRTMLCFLTVGAQFLTVNEHVPEGSRAHNVSSIDITPIIMHRGIWQSSSASGDSGGRHVREVTWKERERGRSGRGGGWGVPSTDTYWFHNGHFLDIMH